MKKEEDYEEGDEWWVKEDIEYFDKITTYLKEGVDDQEFSNLLYAVEFEGRNPQIGIIWSIQDLPSNVRFYNFNNIVWLDIPYID